MRVTEQVRQILSWYEGETPGVKTNLVRLLMQGTARRHRQARHPAGRPGLRARPGAQLRANPPAYDPHYLYELAIEAGLSAYAAPLGPLEQGADTFAGQVPTILKMNSANSLAAGRATDQAVTASVKDALRLGCVGVGFTIYPGSDACYDQMEELRDIIREAQAAGLVVGRLVLSARRQGLEGGETALDIVAYAAHMAALMGAHIIKVKPPTRPRSTSTPRRPPTRRPRCRSRRSGADPARRAVPASPASGWSCSRAARPRTTEGLLEDVRADPRRRRHGSIIGRNIFQRPQPEALELLDQVVKIYLGQA